MDLRVIIRLPKSMELEDRLFSNGYAAMDKYNVSYQQVYSWTRKYEQNGADGLIDRRGKAKSENELTELDKLRIENKRLAAENHRIEMENAILKKLQEIERRRH